MNHTFSNNATLSFTKNANDFYEAEVTQGDQTHRIPLLIEEFEYFIIRENLNAIKWTDVPFSTFCTVITGLFSTIIKYKSPVVRALESRSPFTDPRH